MELWIVLIVWAVSAMAVAWIAQRDGEENPSGPFLLGLLVGPIALVLALVLVYAQPKRA